MPREFGDCCKQGERGDPGASAVAIHQKHRGFSLDAFDLPSPIRYRVALHGHVNKLLRVHLLVKQLSDIDKVSFRG
jgi:hypothetical protein